jgi:RNA polymerase sigma-70 factor (ECF subfamily)
VALSEIDRNLLERCLAGAPRAWEDFVDRYMGLVVHVVNHSAQARSIRLLPQDREDLCAEVFLALVRGDFAALRRFSGRSSLATYLTVIARRVVVRHLIENRTASRLMEVVEADLQATADGTVEDRLTDRDEVERLLEDLNGSEAEIVRMYHLQGKTYREISSATGVAENSIGPALSRARDKLRRRQQADVADVGSGE